MTKAIRWTKEQLAAYNKRTPLMNVDAIYRPSAADSRESKYGNKKTNGYDSKREAKRADMLRLMEKGGEISDLREQVAYELIPRQVDAHGKVIERACSYIADFVYVLTSTGQTVVEDAKGHRTRDYVMKRKLMLSVHGIRVREV